MTGAQALYALCLAADRLALRSELEQLRARVDEVERRATLATATANAVAA